jgi:hypothetical protein
VLFVHQDNSTSLTKALGTPWELFQDKAFQDACKIKSKVLVGHNRWATKGAISVANAHPFHRDHLIGAHNGTLRSTFGLTDQKDFEVDSENLYHHMAKVGEAKGISDANGAFALTWWNTLDQSINFIRNNERPLWWSTSADFKTFFWASEAWMLQVAANKTNTPISKPVEFVEMEYSKVCMGDYKQHTILPLPTKEVVKEYTYIYTPPARGTYYSNYFVAGQKGVDKVDLQDFISSEVEFDVEDKRKLGSQTYLSLVLKGDPTVALRIFLPDNSPLCKKMMGSMNSFTGIVKGGVNFGLRGGYLLVDAETIAEVISKKPPTMYLGYKGILVDKQEYLRSTCSGCAWCTQRPELDDDKEIVWIGHDAFICKDCKDVADVKEHIANN